MMDENDNKYILRYNKGIIDPTSNSILSVAQMRNYLVNVEDNPLVYGGKQRIQTLEEANFSLSIWGGIFHLIIQYPTQQDLWDYPVI